MGKSSQLGTKRKINDDNGETRRSHTTMESERGDGDSQNHRLPLSEVVSDCINRWFEDTLKEAKTGDVNMQVLVAQMYYNGYGVAKDAKKGKLWMNRASKMRSSVWKVSHKRPGYNASDSDSDESGSDA